MPFRTGKDNQGILRVINHIMLYTKRGDSDRIPNERVKVTENPGINRYSGQGLAPGYQSIKLQGYLVGEGSTIYNYNSKRRRFLRKPGRKK